MTWLTNFTIYTVLEVEPVGCKYTNAVKDEATPTSQVSLDEDGDLDATVSCYWLLDMESYLNTL